MSFKTTSKSISNSFFIHVTPEITIGGGIANYTLLSWTDADRKFIPSNISYVLTNKTGNTWTTLPTCSIGTVATSYSNWVASSTSTLTLGIGTVGQFASSTLISGGKPALTNGQSVVLRQSSAGTANAYSTFIFTLEGYLLP